MRTEIQRRSVILTLIEIRHHLCKDHVRENRITAHRRVLRIVIGQPGRLAHLHRVDNRTLVERIKNFRIQRTALAAKCRQNQGKYLDPFNHVLRVIFSENRCMQCTVLYRQRKSDSDLRSLARKTGIGENYGSICLYLPAQTALNGGKLLCRTVGKTDADAEQCRFCSKQCIVADSQRCGTAAGCVNGQRGIGKTQN